MGNRILFVDDERPILKAIERLFFDSEYEVITVESGEEGLKVLAENEVDVVVSDIRMPEMDGHHFLREVKARYPNTTRLILSGYADENDILNSIIDGSSNMYLLKPWDGQDIQDKIMRIMETRKKFFSQGLLELANQLDNMSITPGLYTTVVKLIEEGAGMGTIAAAIETDPTVAAAVLRVANSAFNNIHTGSITRAITFLGLNTIKTTVLSCSLFKNARVMIPPFSVKKLAMHANLANLFLGLIYSDLLGKELPESSQTAGLLNNLGLLVSLHYFPDKYEQAMKKYVERDEKSLTALEQKILGTSHQEIGGYLLHWWGLPYPIVETALFHHEPLNGSIINRELVAAVHGANYLAWQNVSPDLAELEPGIFPALGVRQIDFMRLLTRIRH